MEKYWRFPMFVHERARQHNNWQYLVPAGCLTPAVVRGQPAEWPPGFRRCRTSGCRPPGVCRCRMSGSYIAGRPAPTETRQLFGWLTTARLPALFTSGVTEAGRWPAVTIQRTSGTLRARCRPPATVWQTSSSLRVERSPKISGSAISLSKNSKIRIFICFIIKFFF